MREAKQQQIDSDMIKDAHSMIALTATHWPINDKKKKVRPSSIRFARPSLAPTTAAHSQVMKMMDAMMPAYLNCSSMR